MNWIDEALKAAKTLALYFSGVIELHWVIDERSERYIEGDDGEPRVYYDNLYSYLWTSKLSGGQWGQRAMVALSPDEKSLFVLVDEYQPWGTGMEEPYKIATYPVGEIHKAFKLAFAAMESDFELCGLEEDEESGRYVPAPIRLPDVTNLLSEQAISSH